MTNSSIGATSTNTTTSVSAFIDDGFMVKGVIEERRNIFPEITVTYRPYTWMMRDRASRDMDRFKGGSEEQHEFRAGRLMERIESWSLPREVNKANIKKLQPLLFDVLEQMIFGLIGPDRVLTSNEEHDANAVGADIKN